MKWRGALLRFICFFVFYERHVAAQVWCPVPLSVSVGNKTSTGGRDGTPYSVECSRGCCQGTSDGCCYRTTEDVIVYTVPVCVCLIIIIIILICIFKRLRDKRMREQLEQNKHGQDNPPSYSSCVHPVSSSSTLALAESEHMVEVVIHPPPVEEESEGDAPVPPPPVYDDIFKRVEEDQIAVISPSGHVSFVDHTLIPAIKYSLSQSDLRSKLGDGVRASRSSVSLPQSNTQGYEPAPCENSTNLNDAADPQNKSSNGDGKGAENGVQNYESKIFFSLEFPDEETPLE
ncbi:hypothetical protein Bpfe_006461 [Biomphalaria pfeifferi]|uniref:Uncharacterized protein n=1 Tax=Biomphalaria pfeifferi TaxID=112525 RepID=A0AAD8C0P9_BIOPF|nr:hypothetical protein Bpfe_006461 [Biomphalaria pfeifferi]